MLLSTHFPLQILSLQLQYAQLRLRNLHQHLRHCDMLNTEDSASFSVEYGVNRLSLLNEVPNFDLCKCLPHDIMYVIFEGILPRHIQFLLQNLIFVKHYFTLQQLNQQIKHFHYGYSEEVNKPRLLDRDRIHSTDQTLVQSGIIL